MIIQDESDIGIQDEAGSDILDEGGNDDGQGYAFGEPNPIEENAE